MKWYTKETIWEVRDFLSNTFSDKKHNWLIDRLNFTYSMSRIMNDTSEEDYISKIKCFTDGGIKAITLTEGENRGEAFIAMNRMDLPLKLTQEILDYIEAHLMYSDDKRKFVNLRIQPSAKTIIKEVLKRGYVKQAWAEITMMMPLREKLTYALDHEFEIVQGNMLDAKTLALGHARAFGYYDQEKLVKKAEAGLEKLHTMPDYDGYYDIHIINQNKEIVAFATLWMDKINRLAILEPVGTHYDYRRKGLGTAAIYEACNRALKNGIKKVFVGSDQSFYKAIGFKYHSQDDVYEKSIKDV